MADTKKQDDDPADEPEDVAPSTDPPEEAEESPEPSTTSPREDPPEPAGESRPRRKGAAVKKSDHAALADRIGDGLMWLIALAAVGFVIWTLTLGLP